MNGTHFCDAPTCSFHRKLVWVELVTVARRSKSSNCARLSIPEKGPIVSDFFQPSIFVMPQIVAFIRTCYCTNWSQWLGDPSLPSVLDYPHENKGQLFHIIFNQGYL